MNQSFTRPLFFAGTRPEAIKLSPLIHAFRHDARVSPVFCATGQHTAMLQSVLHDFELTPEMNLEVMQENQSLSSLSARILQLGDQVFTRFKPDSVFVQGDTTTAFIGALLAYYHRVPTFHVEAGLRSHNDYSPWPEEMNRKLVGQIAKYHYCPTRRAQEALLKEGIESQRIRITGNTGIDALLWMKSRLEEEPSKLDPHSQLLASLPLSEKFILVTSHRRENFGEPLVQICQAIRKVSTEEKLPVIFPVHLNPNVRGKIHAELGELSQVHLIEPVPYVVMVKLMIDCHLILTDSGGLQEEAPCLGKPVLVMRENTERPEGIEAGTAKLVGRTSREITEAVSELLHKPHSYARMAKAVNPYGDGTASNQILEHYCHIHHPL